MPQSSQVFTTWQTSSLEVGSHCRDAVPTARSKIVPPPSKNPFPSTGEWAMSESAEQFKLKPPRQPSGRRYPHRIHPAEPELPVRGDRLHFDNQIWGSTNKEFQASTWRKPVSAHVIAYKCAFGSPRNNSTLRERGAFAPRLVDYPRHECYTSRYRRAEARKCLTEVSVPTGEASAPLSTHTSTTDQFPPREYCRRDPICPPQGNTNTLNVGKTGVGSHRTTLHSAFRARDFAPPPHPVFPRNAPGDSTIIPHASHEISKETTTRAEFGAKQAHPSLVTAAEGNKTTVRLVHGGETAKDPFCSTQRAAQLQTLGRKAAPFDARFVDNLKRSHIIFPVGS